MQRPQTRAFGSGALSTHLLATREAAANRNPGSATAQDAFYQLLLKSNMPAIVIERYQSGRFASNEAAAEAYTRALAMISPGSAVHVNGAPAQGGSMSPNAQAIAQAVAAQSRGSNIAFADQTNASGGKAGKGGPLHVVVADSLGTIFFRWFKFIISFAFFAYLSLAILTFMIDLFQRRPGGAGDTVKKSENQKVRFSDVHGCVEAKDELQELVEFLRNPARFNTLGGQLPKGVLLVGPPGTGKTLLARAVAGEAGVPFFYVSGSQFDEMYVGVGARRVRELFIAAKESSPAIIFIDELDSVGSKRSSRDPSHAKQTLNQLLTEMDGFESNSGVIVIAATNFPDSLDKALTRPGRFDRQVVVGLPDRVGRVAVLKHHAKNIKLGGDVNFEAIAGSTIGMSGADLANLVNMAAVRAGRQKALNVRMQDLEWAKDKVVMGSESRSMVIPEEERLATAYHEAGHALVMLSLESDKQQLYKVTILPRGMSLGHTAHMPKQDVYSHSGHDLATRMAVCLGGKMAEELIYGDDRTTSGVSSVSPPPPHKSNAHP